jgi:SpoVK/Ycf46/Vps4 family AAA+-type ATPase
MITSNYPEKLDHALIRPGRIDLILEFKKANWQVLSEMYECFYEEVADMTRIRLIDEYKWSPAEVSQIMFKNYAHPDEALSDLANKDPKEYFKFSHFHRDANDQVAV